MEKVKKKESPKGIGTNISNYKGFDFYIKKGKWDFRKVVIQIK